MEPSSFPVAVDLVILTVLDDDLQVLLIRRGGPPFKGRLALPGGFVVDVRVHLEQLGTYGAPGRDPRGRVITVAHLALVPHATSPSAGSDAASAAWLPVDEALTTPKKLAFDHDRILRDGVERARSKLEYSPLASAFCAQEFTVNELRKVYEAVWGTPLDPRNFHRKVTGTPGFIEPVGATTSRGGGRPAQLFRRGNAERLHPAMLRP
jgi:8-oxo-dGTP diphosphatase